MTITAFPGLAGLSDRLRAASHDLADRWEHAHEITAAWAAEQPDLLAALREQLRALPAEVGAEIAAASRETTTHFAWRLVDQDDAQFSLWLHEYKPQRDWWHGYAGTVHNHRYHFCTMALTGSFLHEWYDVDLDSTGELAREVRQNSSEVWRPGTVRAVTADRFHRVARAADGTLTFLVKSRPVRGWSLSVDPATRVSRRHVPVECRILDLADRL